MHLKWKTTQCKEKDIALTGNAPSVHVRLTDKNSGCIAPDMDTRWLSVLLDKVAVRLMKGVANGWLVSELSASSKRSIAPILKYFINTFIENYCVP
jgi:hypothetical protein